MNEENPLDELENEPTEKLISEEVEEVQEVVEGEEKSEDFVREPLTPEQEAVRTEKNRTRYSRRVKRQNDELTQKDNIIKQQADRIKAYEDANRIKAEPDQDDYVDHDDYKRDQKTYQDQEVNDRVQAQLTEERNKESQSKANREYNRKAQDYAMKRVDAIDADPKYKSYENSVDDAVNAFNAPEIEQAIVRGGGTAMVAYLGKHLDELEDIASMGVYDRMYELGQIANKVKAKAPKKISTAPDPVRSDRGSVKASQAKSSGSRHAYIKGESFKERAMRKNGRT